MERQKKLIHSNGYNLNTRIKEEVDQVQMELFRLTYCLTNSCQKNNQILLRLKKKKCYSKKNFENELQTAR